MDMTLPRYHKINSVFKRDPETNHRTFLMDEFADDAFAYLYHNFWVATEKVDGMNMRIYLPPMGEPIIGGRTENAQIPSALYEHCREVGNRARASELEGLTLYGEGYGAGIQKGGDYRPDQGFILFDVMVTDTGLWLEQENVEDIARQLDIPIVPVAHPSITLRDAVHAFEKGRVTDSFLRKTGPEGWVLRPTIELRNRRGQRVITKLKVKDFA